MWEALAMLAFTAGVASNRRVRMMVRELYTTLEKTRKDLQDRVRDDRADPGEREPRAR